MKNLRKLLLQIAVLNVASETGRKIFTQQLTRVMDVLVICSVLYNRSSVMKEVDRLKDFSRTIEKKSTRHFLQLQDEVLITLQSFLVNRTVLN
ncbi:MAG: hypothetical protein JWN76_2020 [Chitinophagaceae bacterium]|nr:hypothetical protein [Chitinophagaceae bacterium]